MCLRSSPLQQLNPYTLRTLVPHRCWRSFAAAGAPSVGHALNEVFEHVVEGTLQQPTFVLDHPLEISPLAKPHRSKPGCVERWELFIAGEPSHTAQNTNQESSIKKFC